MKEFILKVRSYLSDREQDVYEFSGWLEFYLLDHYEEMRREAPEATQILNEEIPDICSEIEPGDDDTEFREKLKAEFDRAMVYYNK